MARNFPTVVRSWTLPYLSTGAALLTAAGAALLVSVSIHAIVAGAVGVLVMTVGLVRWSPRLLTVGATSLFGSLLVAGVLGMAPEYLLGAAFLTAMAWDAGLLAVGLAEEVGRDVSTLRVEVVRLSSSAVVLAVGGASGYLVFRHVSGNHPMLALVALLFGAIMILAALQA